MVKLCALFNFQLEKVLPPPLPTMKNILPPPPNNAEISYAILIARSLMLLTIILLIICFIKLDNTIISRRLPGFFTQITHLLSHFDDFWHVARYCNYLAACQKSSKCDKRCVIGVKNRGRRPEMTSVFIFDANDAFLVAFLRFLACN